MLASSTAIGVLAHVVAQLSTPWVQASKTDADDDTWWQVHRGFERSDYLTKLAGLKCTPRGSSSNGDQEDDDDYTPDQLRWPCKVLNAMPGISAFGTLEGRDSRRVWALWWTISSADRNLDTGDVGPSIDGWLVTEWLVWLVRDYRRTGKDIESRITAPAPMLNEPGGMLTFAIEADLDGPDNVNPHEFARSIIKLWSGDGHDITGSGYFDVEWPEEKHGES